MLSVVRQLPRPEDRVQLEAAEPSKQLTIYGPITVVVFEKNPRRPGSSRTSFQILVLVLVLVLVLRPSLHVLELQSTRYFARTLQTFCN